MKIGDLLKITYKHGAINYLFGIYMGEGTYDVHPYISVYVDGEMRKMYKLDYNYEVINGNW